MSNPVMQDEHPLLVNDATSLAILNGTQTQDRRLVKPQPTPLGHIDAINYGVCDCGKTWCQIVSNGPTPDGHSNQWEMVQCSPFGKPGDVLWVREAYRVTYHKHQYRYRSTPPVVEGKQPKWRPNIHMPRTACRTLLTAKRVWVERVQDITEEGARAEGCVSADSIASDRYWPTALDTFRNLWESIYPGSWDHNDWVWCCEFERKDGAEC